MKRNKLLTLFAAVMLLFGVQSANAGVTLTCISGSDFGAGEGPAKLVDGTQDTKWGTWAGWYYTYEGADQLPNAIFRAALPIAVAEYELVIANDTQGNPGRNWKSWRIFGGNFASDADATYSGTGEGWVLLDQKVDQAMTTEPFAVVPFTLSNPTEDYYSYFMIIVDAICEAETFNNYTQMDEFRFVNEKVDTSAGQVYLDYEPTGVDADLVDAYNAKKAALQAAYDAADVEAIIAATTECGQLKDKIETLLAGGYIPLDGSAGWGDGHYSQLVDKNEDTKWGGNFSGSEGSPEHVQYVVFRCLSQQPFFYKLVTGGDTERQNTRNWKTWKVFGGNFASEEAAAKDAEGWVVLDDRTNISTDYLPNKNKYPATLNFTNGVSASYSYYKVEVYASSGTQQQMSEMYLCTEEEFNEIRQGLVDALAEFAATVEGLTVVSGEESKKDEFLTKYAELQTTTNADVLTIIYNELVALKEALEESAAFAAGGYRPLNGSAGWGDGHYSQLVDGNINTKWGGGIPDDGAFIIFKAYEAKQFPYYELITGNDTQRSPGRNWKTWKIYGANVKGDMDEMATRDFAGWTLIDQKTDIGQDLLPPANFAPAYFTFSESWPTNYKYFKIEVEAAYDGGAIQMSEFKMLTNEDWEAERQTYIDDLMTRASVLATSLGDVVIPVALQNEILAESQALALAVTTATPEQLLPAYNAALEYMDNAPALIAEYALVPVDGVYQIANLNQLKTFQEVVNAGENTIDAVLTADITMDRDVDWNPIGTPDVPFKGTFDGQGHAFTYFYGTTDAAVGKYGLFGNIEGATVKNFSISGHLTVPEGAANGSGVIGWATSSTISNIYSTLDIEAGGNGAKHVGGIVGSAQGGVNTISNCTFAGSLTVAAGSHDCFAGIAGYMSSDKILNCANYGTIDYYTNNCYAGGITGYINAASATVANCLNVGAVTYKGEGTSTYGGAFVGRLRKDAANIKNNYWLAGSAEKSSGEKVLAAPAATEVTAEQLASGEVAYKLNLEQTEDVAWYQDLSTKIFVAEQYVVTVNGTDQAPKAIDVTLIGSDTYTFTLHDFVLTTMSRDVYVGDISLSGIEIADDGTFAKNGTFDVPAESIPAELSMYAPFFKDIPFTLAGKVNDKKLYATIDITVSLISTTVQVVAGVDDFEAAAPALTPGDVYPVLDDTHGVVYPIATLHCDGTLYAAATGYANDPAASTQDAHDFVDGLCSYCGTIDETYMTPNADGFFEIADAKQLQWFAAYVNQIDAVANGLVVSDIGLSDVITGDELKFSIGTDAVPFKGVFDGDGHTIYDITYTAKGQYNCLFGKLAGSAVVKNFRAIGTVDVSTEVTGRAVALIAMAGGDDVRISNIYSDVYFNNELAGAQVGGILGGALNGYTTVDRCWYAGELDGKDAGGSGNYGGIVAYANNNSACNLTITNCLFDGKLFNTADTPGTCTFGGMVGYSNGAIVTIKNCLSVGTVDSPRAGQFFGAVKNANSAIINCYYQGDKVNSESSTVTTTPEDATKATDEQLLGGFVAARLAPAFRQTIGYGHPTLNTDLPMVAEITEAGYATFYQEETDLKVPAGIEVFTGVKSGHWFLLDPVEDKFAASEPVILRGEAGYYMFDPTTDATKAAANDLKGTAEGIEADGNMYILAQPEGEEIAFYRATPGTTISRGKAYLEDVSGVKAFLFDEDGATGIAEVETAVENGAIYNVAGQRLQKMQKGINIVGNKKVLK